MERIIKPPNINTSKAQAIFTTKFIGDIREKLRMVADLFNVPLNKIFIPDQRHTAKIHILNDTDSHPQADGIITDKKGVVLGVQVADCAPILMYDPVKGVIGAVHAGWRGSASSIIRRAIKEMMLEFGSKAGDIKIAIGPSIRLCSYEVDQDVFTAIKIATGEGDYYRKSGSKYFVDLAIANMLQATMEGIPKENIWISEECTFCNPERFHSYRYFRDHAGRQGGFIVMW